MAASMEDLINVTLEPGEKSKSLEKILLPTTIVSWILGVGIARPLKCPKAITILLRLINFGVCSVIVVYGAIDFFFFGSVFRSDTFKIIYYFNKAVCYISSYYYVFHGIIHYSKWPTFVQKIGKIDIKMRQSGLQNDNRSIRIFQVLTLIATFAVGPFSLVSHTLYYLYYFPEDLFASDLLLYHTIAQSLTVNFGYTLIVFGIYTRFRVVNKGICRIGDQFTAEMIILEIRRAREVHHAICSLVRYINTIYGIHLLLSSLNAFTMIVGTLFRIYMGVIEKRGGFMTINNVIWMTYATQFSLTCCVCTFACRESSKTGILVHEIVVRRMPKGPRPSDLFSVETSRATDDPEISLRTEISDFSSQLDHSIIKFSACDFFTMDNELLQCFIGVITTYLIILVQFYVPEHRYEDQPSTPTPETNEI